MHNRVYLPIVSKQNIHERYPDLYMGRIKELLEIEKYTFFVFRKTICMDNVQII